MAAAVRQLTAAVRRGDRRHNGHDLGDLPQAFT
jgi:hypothetical protein